MIFGDDKKNNKDSSVETRGIKSHGKLMLVTLKERKERKIVRSAHKPWYVCRLYTKNPDKKREKEGKREIKNRRDSRRSVVAALLASWFTVRLVDSHEKLLFLNVLNSTT